MSDLDAPSGFASLLPAVARSVEVTGADELEPLVGPEADLVAGAGPRRRWEVRAGRHCARAALAAAGVGAGGAAGASAGGAAGASADWPLLADEPPPAGWPLLADEPPPADWPLLADQRGVPRWPPGWTGGITHSGDRCAAAVAPVELVPALGMDLERGVPSARVAARVLTAGEREALRALPPGIEWAAVVFSAKESFYKAWRPLIGTRLRFSDVELALDPEGGRFAVRFTRSLGPAAPSPSRFVGRFSVEDGWVRTAVALLPG